MATPFLGSPSGPGVASIQAQAQALQAEQVEGARLKGLLYPRPFELYSAIRQTNPIQVDQTFFTQTVGSGGADAYQPGQPATLRTTNITKQRGLSSGEAAEFGALTCMVEGPYVNALMSGVDEESPYSVNDVTLMGDLAYIQTTLAPHYSLYLGAEKKLFLEGQWWEVGAPAFMTAMFRGNERLGNMKRFPDAAPFVVENPEVEFSLSHSAIAIGTLPSALFVILKYALIGIRYMPVSTTQAESLRSTIAG